MEHGSKAQKEKLEKERENALQLLEDFDLVRTLSQKLDIVMIFIWLL
jgi:hypothetical protein